MGMNLESSYPTNKMTIVEHKDVKLNFWRFLTQGMKLELLSMELGSRNLWN